MISSQLRTTGIVGIDMIGTDGDVVRHNSRVSSWMPRSSFANEGLIRADGCGSFIPMCKANCYHVPSQHSFSADFYPCTIALNRVTRRGNTDKEVPGSLMYTCILSAPKFLISTAYAIVWNNSVAYNRNKSTVQEQKPAAHWTIARQWLTVVHTKRPLGMDMQEQPLLHYTVAQSHKCKWLLQLTSGDAVSLMTDTKGTFRSKRPHVWHLSSQLAAHRFQTGHMEHSLSWVIATKSSTPTGCSSKSCSRTCLTTCKMTIFDDRSYENQVRNSPVIPQVAIILIHWSWSVECNCIGQIYSLFPDSKYAINQGWVFAMAKSIFAYQTAHQLAKTGNKLIN